MSATSEELESLREGESTEGVAAGPDETVLLDAVRADGKDGVPGAGKFEGAEGAEGAKAGAAVKPGVGAKNEAGPKGDAGAEAADAQAGAGAKAEAAGSNGTAQAVNGKAPAAGAGARDAAGSAREADDEAASDADSEADSEADSDAADESPTVVSAAAADSGDGAVRRRSTPGASTDEWLEGGDIKRRQTARDAIPHNRDHGLPKYTEPTADPDATVVTPVKGARPGAKTAVGAQADAAKPAADAPAGKSATDKPASDKPAAGNPDLAATVVAPIPAASSAADAVPPAPAAAAGAAVADRPADRPAKVPAAGTRLAPPVDAAPGVAQDVADETARAVAEAVGDGGMTADAPGAGSDADAEPDFSAAAPPRRPDRHTPLYGKGVRVLPWKHKSRLTPPQRKRRRITVGTLWAAVLVFVGTIGWSILGALTAPGTDTIQVRLAEWGRDHGLGGVVSTLEKWQYDLNPPKKGGTVDQSQFADLGPTAEPAKPSATKGGKTGGQPADAIQMRPPMAGPAGLTLEPGEGVFHPAVSTPDGQPVIQLARIRPDAVYTSVTADVLWIDQKHTRYVLHPGHEGGVNKQVPVPNQINADARPGLIALFNGGFKISESNGGYYDHGVTVAPLVDGAASEVIFADGHMSVGMWGRDYSFAKNPDIVSVRQNLKLMVDNGQVVPYINEAGNWGRSDHGSAAVWRSGVGVTAQGDIVYVAGNDLTAPSLADLLQRAGAVHAMQLDINLRWADFQYFPYRDGNPDTSKLYGDFLQGATKFFADSTKDFMAVYLR